ncbi:hypothetical protein [Rhizobium aethiopicum]|uniref:hypothetical protein n=1 Tax=Rhizobium aethiopicum TaxID=1138170 RepID=UPI001428984C|nr:hypothetical protein [Rhizobium aethiopicum]
MSAHFDSARFLSESACAFAPEMPSQDLPQDAFLPLRHFPQQATPASPCIFSTPRLSPISTGASTRCCGYHSIKNQPLTESAVSNFTVRDVAAATGPEVTSPVPFEKQDAD